MTAAFCSTNLFMKPLANPPLSRASTTAVKPTRLFYDPGLVLIVISGISFTRMLAGHLETFGFYEEENIRSVLSPQR